MSRTKKILLGLLAMFIIIQFIQPARNNNGQVLPGRLYKLDNNEHCQ